MDNRDIRTNKTDTNHSKEESAPPKEPEYFDIGVTWVGNDKLPSIYRDCVYTSAMEGSGLVSMSDIITIKTRDGHTHLLNRHEIQSMGIGPRRKTPRDAEAESSEDEKPRSLGKKVQPLLCRFCGSTMEKTGDLFGEDGETAKCPSCSYRTVSRFRPGPPFARMDVFAVEPPLVDQVTDPKFRKGAKVVVERPRYICGCGREMSLKDYGPDYRHWICNCGTEMNIRFKLSPASHHTPPKPGEPEIVPLKVEGSGEVQTSQEPEKQDWMTLREALAAYSHGAWAQWMKYLFKKCADATPKDMSWVDRAGTEIPPDLEERWTRQMNTPYHELPDAEKKSDLEEADKILEIVSKHRHSHLESLRRSCNTLLDHLDMRDGSGPMLTVAEAERLTKKVVDAFDRDFKSIIPDPHISRDHCGDPVPYAEGWNACREEVIRRMKMPWVIEKEKSDGNT